jgi:hypothetical protein
VAAVARMADFEDRRRPGRAPSGGGQVVSISTGRPFVPAPRATPEPPDEQGELFGLEALLPVYDADDPWSPP